MSLIFATSPGTAVAIRSDGASPFAINIANSYFEAIAINVSVDQQVAAQIQTTLAETVYVTPFGDRPGTLNVSYVLNGVGCDADANDQSIRFFNDYNSTKLTTSGNTSPHLFVIGRASFKGFILGAKMAVSAEGGLFMMTGQIQAVVWQ